MAANHPMSLFSCSIQFHLNDVLLMVRLHMQVIVNSRNTTSYAEQLKLVGLLAWLNWPSNSIKYSAWLTNEVFIILLDQTRRRRFIFVKTKWKKAKLNIKNGTINFFSLLKFSFFNLKLAVGQSFERLFPQVECCMFESKQRQT